MKITRWLAHLAAALAVCVTGSAFAQVLWRQLPSTGNDIGAGTDGSVWMIGNDAQGGGNYGIYRWNGGNWDKMPGGAVRITVGPRGDAWVINAAHQIYHWTGSGWTTIPGTGLDIAAGGNGDVWLIGTDRQIWKWDPVASWQKKPGQADRIAVNTNGQPWVVQTNTHNIFQWNGSNWSQISGGAIDIACGGDGSVWIAGNDGSVFQYNGKGGWTKTTGNLSNIAVDNKGYPWGVNAGKQIFASGPATLPPAGPKGVSYLGTGGNLSSGQYLVSDNKAFFAIQQPDGNLCVYKGSSPSDNKGGLWCHNKVGAGGQFYTVMQGDGNLCTYYGTGNGDQRQYNWCSMAVPGPGTYFMIVQTDGNLCVYRGTYQSYGSVVWCSGATAPVAVTAGTAPPLTAAGTATFVKATRVDPADMSFPANQPCVTQAYTVPAGANYVTITAVGGAGLGGDIANLVGTIAALGGMVAGKDGVSAPGTSWADITGGSGGRGASVTGTFKVTPGQQLYVLAGLSGAWASGSSRGGHASGFPGGGFNGHPAGGYSLVATQAPTRTTGDPNYCYVAPSALLIVAGGGGSGGWPGTAGFGGSGGDAGLLGEFAKAGGSGGGALSGGGGGGGTQSSGGAVGSHPGCGSELRSAGSYLRGSDEDGWGGAGGGGYYGGGGGGGRDCFLGTGSGGGGGGSSYIHPTALSVSSALDMKYYSGVTLTPMKSQ